jgi:membrane associated rhomboid family serine protease
MATSRIQEFLSTVPAVTRILLFTNIAVHILLFVTSFPSYELAITPILIVARGEYYRLISSAFVHGGLLHIGMNMSTLLAIGRSLEMQYGSVTMMFLTLWALVLCGVMFVSLVW